MSTQLLPGRVTLWERVWSSRLRREVTIALLVKLVLLIVVWWAFFSDPIDQDLDHYAVERALIASPNSEQGAGQR